MRNELKWVPVPPRALSNQERAWVQEILQSNPHWADVDLESTRVVKECSCGRSSCRAVYLGADAPQNPRLKGTMGYIGRVEIRTKNEFGIVVTLDQHDGNLGELYINFLDLEAKGDREPPVRWEEIAHTVTGM